MDSVTPVLIVAVFASVVGFFIFRIYRHGGFKAAMFGARIERTVGEVSGEGKGPVGVKVKVHILRREPAGKLVGVEFVAKSIVSYQMMPVTLSEEQARQLASLLDEAVRS